LKTSFTPSPDFIHLKKVTSVKHFFSTASGNQEEIVGLFTSGVRFFKIFKPLQNRAPGKCHHIYQY
jgi:hypothetical protein